MEQKEINDIREKLNIAGNIIDGVLVQLAKAEKKTTGGKKSKKKVSEEIKKTFAEMGELNQELTVTQCLERYEQPTDDDHVNSVLNIMRRNNIEVDQLEGVLERIQAQAKKNGVEDIKKYTYACLHKVNQTKE